MGGDEIEIPIYLITGFLESGKTTFINFTVAQDYFQIDEPTLLITTEEGEVEYDEKGASEVQYGTGSGRESGAIYAGVSEKTETPL